MGSVEGEDVVRSQALERAFRENNHSFALLSGLVSKVSAIPSGTAT
jgi:hypothetical protein